MNEEELDRLRVRRYELNNRIRKIEEERTAVIDTLILESLRRRIDSPVQRIIGDDGEDYGEEEPLDLTELDAADGVDDGRFISPFYWDCPDRERNVLRFCIYDDFNDPPHDFCLFCHEPEERK